MIPVCVPVLNRHDLFERLRDSLEAGEVKPPQIIVIDNGQKWSWRPKEGTIPVEVFTPMRPMGVAESWNWFIDRADSDVLLANDDIVFGPQSYGTLIAQPSCFVSCHYGFSCFVLRRECVEKVGRFDETISPGYAYYEDRDYYNRMQVARIQDIVVECGVLHEHSATLQVYTPLQMEEHHRKFAIAHKNFLKKWGESEWSPSLSRPSAVEAS
jgi:hypothetical protein